MTNYPLTNISPKAKIGQNVVAGESLIAES